MKIVVFESLLLVSNVLKKSRFITFGQTTVITGSRNTTGKSSILKSLYHTLGANVVFEDEWHPLDVKSLLRFSFEQRSYTVLRDGAHITFFDDNWKVLISTESITKVLAPFVAQFFDFNLPLVLSSSNEETQAVPAVLYLPFYIDQDLGWGSYFASFPGLQMFSRWQEAFKNYHTGIRPREFYELGNRLRAEEKLLHEIDNEKVILLRTKEKVESALQGEEVVIDVEELKNKLYPLTEQYAVLYQAENEIRKRSYRLVEDRAEIQRQIQEISEQIKSNERELSAANQFAEVVCPRCGSLHESSLYHQYALSSDTTDLKEFLRTLEDEEEMLNEDSCEIDRLFMDAKEAASDIKFQINQFQSDISMHEVLQTIARRKAEDVFITEVNDNNQRQEKIISSIGAIERERKKILDKKRTKKIKNDYIDFLANFFHELSVDSSDLKAYRTHFTPPQNKLKTGSRGARQMIALYYAFINTVYKYSTSAKFPIVIDSPKQQEQDNLNADVISKFCTVNRPDSAQVILATLNYQTDNKEVKVYTLEEKKGLLMDENYLEHSQEILLAQELALKYTEKDLTMPSI